MMAGYTWEQYLEFINGVPPDQQEIDFFSSVGWVRPYLQVSSPFTPIPFFSRFEKGNSNDRFFNKIINTPGTISNALGLVRKENDWATRFAVATNNGNAGTSQKQKEPDFILLAHLGTDLSGFTDTAHGGVLGALFDEAMSCCAELFRQASDRKSQLFTANLSVSYRAPVDVPAVVMIRIWLERRDGRKWFLRGKLTGEDGAVKAEAEALWISAKTKENL
ncbi:hypothetical protein P152DRAFT_12046 [Eremomyces bilateralis CBS 781.70]|uniref:Thioesterase domain-containing protein n=1 Tax=Eremomyces bilateralis CBS 781.70 TaxID=1392243 RepID=A0A6G1GGU8_9PEZI|nr:uncharacterized protein P152DRAFT_12046 [Eremomyces bilateralis CBS 781.70]KAF1817234.1 hypothetical protein P152DRAFT_12046 [Eremomyces bilateralis CBS 781.70]